MMGVQGCLLVFPALFQKARDLNLNFPFDWELNLKIAPDMSDILVAIFILTIYVQLAVTILDRNLANLVKTVAFSDCHVHAAA